MAVAVDPTERARVAAAETAAGMAVVAAEPPGMPAVEPAHYTLVVLLVGTMEIPVAAEVAELALQPE